MRPLRDRLSALAGHLSSTFDPVAEILAAVLRERVKQLDKWGDQTHPCVPYEVPNMPPAFTQAARITHAAFERVAKADCEAATRAGRLSWFEIAWEELAEVGNAPIEKRRTELVQTIAVLVAWLEDLDARTTATEDSTS